MSVSLSPSLQQPLDQPLSFIFLIAPLYETTPCLSIHLQGEAPPLWIIHYNSICNCAELSVTWMAECSIRPVQYSLCLVVRSVRPPRRCGVTLVGRSFVRSWGCHLAEALPLLRVIRLQSKDPPTVTVSQSQSVGRTQQQQHLRLPCPSTEGNFSPLVGIPYDMRIICFCWRIEIYSTVFM